MLDGGKKRVLVEEFGESRSYSVEGLVGCEGVGGVCIYSIYMQD